MHRLILLICLLASVAMVIVGARTARPYERPDTQDEADGYGNPIERLGTVLDNDRHVARYERHLEAMPNDGCQRLHFEPLKRSFRQQFRDSNYLHLQVASRIGIDPIHSPEDIWKARRPLVRMYSGPDFYIDSLRYSYPYLVPEASALLHEIGREFNTELALRGGGHYRLKVTSMLRTPRSVRRLRRVNGNAADTSAHEYGTTFDISHSQFICDARGVNRTAWDLKGLLAEILARMQAQQRCYIAYEYRQACFHITVRPKED